MTSPARATKAAAVLHDSLYAMAILVGMSGASAQDFFKGKDITLYVGSGPGGAYDTYGRLLARHFGRHVPGNPNVVVQNMPGAAGRRMINYIYNVAPKDGTAFATALSTLAFDPLIGEESQFVAQKLTWIGSANKETSTCILWHASPIRSIDDLRTRTMAVGSSGPSSTDSIYPNVLSYLFGMKFKIVAGYASSPEMSLALERGELDGRCGLTLSSLQSVRPPGVAPERVDILRRAFDRMVKDRDYVADSTKTGLGTDAITGEDVEALVNQVYATPKDVVAKAAIAARGR